MRRRLKYLRAVDIQHFMDWVKPEFEEISLCMEVTAYVNEGE
jgi:coenzyme PQQ precursor peptide PqqA